MSEAGLYGVTVAKLIADGVLHVEDGNHGEYRPRKEEFSDRGVAFIRAADLARGRIDFEGASKVNQAALERIRKGVGAPQDTILSHKGTVGKVAYAGSDCPPFVCSPQTTVWRSQSPEQLHPLYLYYELHSQHFTRQLSALQDSTDMAPYVSLTQQRSMWINVPPLQVQKSAVAVLSALDAKIAANEQLIRAAEGLVTSFCLAGKSKITPLRDLVELVRSQVSPSAIGVPEVAHYGIPAFDSRRMPEIVSPSEIKSSKFQVTDSAVLVSKLNPATPRVWLIDPVPDVPAIASTEFLVLTPIDGIPASAVWAVCSQPQFWGELLGKVTGTSNSHQRVRPADLLETEVVDPRSLDPSLTEQIDVLCQRVAMARNESHRLTRLRDSLLPGLMSGELKVREAERAAGQAV